MKTKTNYFYYSQGHHCFHYILHPLNSTELMSYSEGQFVSNNLRKAIATDALNAEREVLHDPHFSPTDIFKCPTTMAGAVGALPGPLRTYRLNTQQPDLQRPEPASLCIRASSVLQSPPCHLNGRTAVPEN